MSERRQLIGELYPFDVFQGVQTRPLALIAPATVDNEERAFLIEVAISATKKLRDERWQDEEEERAEFAVFCHLHYEMLDELQLRTQGSSSSAACAVAVPALVLLSESEVEEDTKAVITQSFIAPQWTDDSHVAALTNTLTALTLAGLPVSSTSVDDVPESLRKVVTITAAPSEP